MESSRMKNLAVWQKKEEFLEALRVNQTVIVVGDCYSGKTTQIPQFVLEEEAVDLADDDDGSKGMIACTLPRKLAAISASQCVAEEMGVDIGEEVGYSVPLEEDCISSKTVIKYLTDSMLVREAMAAASDRLLERYRVIIVDGAHERSLATDILLAFLKQVVLKNRPQLKLVVMGAPTILEAHGKFENYFHGAPLVKLPQAMLHPVELFYTLELEKDYLEAAIQAVVKMHMSEPAGDILVFLAKEEEIEKACHEIKREIDNYNNNNDNNRQAQAQDVVGPGAANVLPLYSPDTMLMHHQNDPERKRKIVLSTHTAAEYLLTMIDDGIVYVLDTGFAKRRVYDPWLGHDAILAVPTTQASADWRTRCAGRIRPGKCFRLYPERSFHIAFLPHTKPEILESTDLVNTVLTLKKLGIEDLLRFDFMDRPNPETLIRALERLNHLGALDDHGNLTEVGESMSESTAIIDWLHLLALAP
ncbi:hypothetical protein FEM48_Zijuj09G0207500 [Ziziphus jujuba var. spinosa]|uniref:RNA helicase n=1 Tax=Ziziphus jujuba var. spinosa TaxID=714518 RepID=A0A978UV82_ZIZJJ|nr:hypothetical protein FEM48_Zijuj09G0207500 [Ziziphus jujuba var. spinosa]